MLQDLMYLKFSKRYFSLLVVLMSLGGFCVNSIWNTYKGRIVLRKLRKCKQKQKLSAKGRVGEEMMKSNDAKTNICEMDMEDLVRYLREDADNYKIVFKSFQSKALHEDQRLNCVVEFVKLDVSEVDLSGPFAGMPVSIKDNITIKGYDSYVGCSYFLNKPKPKESAVLLSALQRLGAIPFVKSTVPQTMMTILSSNPIDGITKNPQNIKFIPGGSSSGEGALVGSKASICGFGSDIGGSVRIPAAFCGVVGLKPTVDRMSMSGGFTIGVQSLVRSVFGPICRDVSSCAFVMKTLFDSGHMSVLDPIVPRVPFNDEDYNRKRLKIGFFTHDNSFPVMPAMKRAVEESVAKLRSEGHEVVPFQPPLTGRDWWTLFLRAITIDGGQRMKSIVRHDKIDDAIRNRLLHVDFTFWEAIYNRVKYSLPSWLVDADKKTLYACCTERLSSSQCDALRREIEAFKRRLMDDWAASGIDVLLCPAGGFTALPTRSEAFLCPLLTYIFLWNLVNFPAGTVPVSKVLQADIDTMARDPLYRSSPTLEGISKDQMGTLGLSVSVQCVALPWKEELCLNLMRKLQR